MTCHSMHEAEQGSYHSKNRKGVVGLCHDGKRQGAAKFNVTESRISSLSSLSSLSNLTFEQLDNEARTGGRAMKEQTN
jgi:hypothetical protein